MVILDHHLYEGQDTNWAFPKVFLSAILAISKEASLIELCMSKYEWAIFPFWPMTLRNHAQRCCAPEVLYIKSQNKRSAIHLLKINATLDIIYVPSLLQERVLKIFLLLFSYIYF